ncbi:MAG: MoaD/ThiS family protein [Acidimicrobiales bacterium]
MIRVVLPAHLRTLARAPREVEIEVDGIGTQAAVLDALEERFPALLGTLRDRTSKQRRPFVRFFACENDLSNQAPQAPLPDEVLCGKEPFVVLGAIAGG